MSDREMVEAVEKLGGFYAAYAGLHPQVTTELHLTATMEVRYVPSDRRWRIYATFYWLGSQWLNSAAEVDAFIALYDR